MAAGSRRRALALALALAAALGAAGLTAEDPCARATASAVLTKGRAGNSPAVRGTVYRSDGKTPAAGVILYVYQTDATGLYARERGADPRIHGWMRTDAAGRFEFLTIRPAPYPNRTEPAHIHTHLWGAGVPTQWNVELLFADDPLVRPRQREVSDALGRFAFVESPVKGSDGIFETTLDIRLKESGDTFEDNILHGLKPCGVNPPVR
jgi:protocatechuate 3,4-dioxygenase beta subunit